MKNNSSKSIQTIGDDEQVSQLRQLLSQQIEELSALIWKMGDSDPLIMGSYYQVYKSCTQPNCRCQQGQKHGPFPALSWSVNGKKRMVMVRQEDAAMVARKAAAYRQFQKNLTDMRRLMGRIDELIVKIRSLLLQEYQ
jgi:hypothetical protein